MTTRSREQEVLGEPPRIAPLAVNEVSDELLAIITA